jgi:hypothetical protein
MEFFKKYSTHSVNNVLLLLQKLEENLKRRVISEKNN